MSRPPAFCSSSSLLPYRSHKPHRSPLAPRRHNALPSPPRRRPRRSPVHAVFIWTNDFSDDHPDERDPESDQPDDEDDDDSSDPQFFELSDESWRRTKRATDQSDHPSSPFGPSHFSRINVDAADHDDSHHQSDPASNQSSHRSENPLFEAVRTHTQGPDDTDRLRRLVSNGAADTFRDVVTAVLGNMPSDVYEVIITTDRSGMSRLMHSSLCTGYALRNAEFRMLLNDTMHTFKSTTALEPNSPDDATPAPVRDLFGAQVSSNRQNASRRVKSDTSRAKGDITWWDSEQQAKHQLSAAEYIAKLEAENELLRERLTATQMNGANRSKLMAFVRTLTPQKLLDLQASLGDDALDAFKSVVKTVLGEFSVSKVQMTYSTTRDYMAHVTFWCLLVGYCVRNIEKRMEMTKIFERTESYVESTSE